VGFPVLASLNCALRLAVGKAGKKVKAATGVDEPDVLDEADPPSPRPQPRNAKDTRKMSDSNDIFFPDINRPPINILPGETFNCCQEFYMSNEQSSS
jgi:hypothetical protein